MWMPRPSRRHFQVTTNLWSGEKIKCGSTQALSNHTVLLLHASELLFHKLTATISSSQNWRSACVSLEVQTTTWSLLHANERVYSSPGPMVVMEETNASLATSKMSTTRGMEVTSLRAVVFDEKSLSLLPYERESGNAIEESEKSPSSKVALNESPNNWSKHSRPSLFLRQPTSSFEIGMSSSSPVNLVRGRIHSDSSKFHSSGTFWFTESITPSFMGITDTKPEKNLFIRRSRLEILETVTITSLAPGSSKLIA